jgi:hypothetical protein
MKIKWEEEYEEQEREIGNGLGRFTREKTKFHKSIKNKKVFQATRKTQHSINDREERCWRQEFQQALDDAREIAKSNNRWARLSKRALKRMAPNSQ